MSGQRDDIVDGIAALAHRLRAELGDAAVLTDRTRLRTYECDGLAHYKVTPAVVVLPRSTGQVAATVRACHDAGVPFVARGSGTGLSGGALPHAEGVLIVLSQMRTIRELDPADQRAVLDPGVINLQVSKAAAPHGYYYAPDPSSQQICSIGGNVAENSGGAHCLKYGFTTNHVTGLELVTPEGDVVRLGGRAPDPPGYDLLGAFVGSEGTLGVTTEVTVRLTRAPETVRTLLGGLPVDRRGRRRGVGRHRRRGGARGDRDDGRAGDRGRRGGRRSAATPRVPARCWSSSWTGRPPRSRRSSPRSSGTATTTPPSRSGSPPTRPSGRCSGRAASPPSPLSGRISPDYIVQDGVIPRTALPEVLRKIADLSGGSGVRVANVFHAGDGNLHPLVLFDDSVPGQAEAAEKVSGAILDLCIEHGGSITGEHGVGMDKAKYMPRMFTDDDLDTMQMLRCAFDPQRLSNPGKVFPTPRLCGERPGRHKGPHPLQQAGLAEVF